MFSTDTEKKQAAVQVTPVDVISSGDTTPTLPPSENVPALSDADRKLEAMGYKPREFSAWSSFSFAMSISGIYSSLMSAWVYGLQAGGPAAVMWSWIVGGAGAWAMAMSLAELSSAYPSAGAMYSVLRYVAPEGQAPFLCWMSGYVSLAGIIAGTASGEYASSQMLLAAISIATDFRYVPTPGHIFGVMVCLSVVHGAINSLPTRWLTRLTSGYVVFHMSVLVGACVCLLVKTEGKNSVAYAFTEFEPALSGWSPPGFAFLFGCLTPAWIMTNADSTARLAEEAINPALVVPNAIATATTFTYFVGLLFNLVLVVCMTAATGSTPSALLQSPTGQPVAQLFANTLGRAPAVFFTLAGFGVMNLCSIPGIQGGSRTIFAYGRDDLLPWSGVWRRLDTRSGTPVAAVWLFVALSVAVNFLGLIGEEAAVAAVFNICTVALNLSYVLPIVCKLMYGRFERGPWHLGRWSLPMNIVAVGWNVFVSVIFFLPTKLPVTNENMNYASVVFVFVTLFSLGFWYAQGRHYYTGAGSASKKSSQSSG
ncbi:amino acid/polyamine transporter I [Dichotomopilus funicola]|uniref:Amino acid/polyamine transporter I n=1 Tax=Dichotomopilus funicola TaxID=1934379 RepID=A0AAN6V4X2_9PEZI|nr:amino acid/polyamine transporter I [Dichotomopilus funicola]